MANNKDFNIVNPKEFLVNAEKFLSNYERKRQSSKSKFIKELIDYQHFFGDQTIVDCSLLLSGRYQKNIVDAVLSDLGCKITFYDSEKGLISVIKFTSTEG